MNTFGMFNVYSLLGFSMKILLIGDDPNSFQVIIEHLNQLGCNYQFDRGSWSLYNADLLNEIDLVLVNEYHVADSGKLARLRQQTSQPIFLLSTAQDDEILAQLYAVGVDDHLVLPVSYPILAAKLRVWQRWIVRSSSMLPS